MELIDCDVREFAMTELISPQPTTAWRSNSEIKFVLVDDFSSMRRVVCERRPRCSSRLHSVQALTDASDFCVVSVCVVA